jgi:uncharacterized protein YxeA
MQSPDIAELVLQWQQAPRLRIGAIIILMIVFFLGLDTLANYKTDIEQDYIATEKRYQKLQGISQQQWQEKAEKTRATRVELEQGLWQAETKGLAQAKIQSWLNRQIKIKGLQTNVNTAEELVESSQLWQVETEIKGVMNWQQLIKLLGTIELNPNNMLIQTLSIQASRKLLRVDIQISSIFQASVVNE